MKKFAFFLSLFSILYLSTFSQQALDVNIFQTVIAKKNNQQLVDVRTEREFKGGHIKGARNLDIRSKTFKTDIQKLDKNEPVYVYCLSGGRSASAARLMQQMGFTEIYDLKGGMISWKNANLPVKTNNSNGNTKNGLSLTDYKSKLKTKKPVLVNFFAPWCAPCRKMAPMLNELEAQYRGKFEFVKLNADDNEALRKALQVTEIPTFLVHKNGKTTWKHAGLVSEEILVKELGL